MLLYHYKESVVECRLQQTKLHNRHKTYIVKGGTLGDMGFLFERMYMSGWVSIHRKIENNWVWNIKPFDYAHAWIDLILMANHADTKELRDGKLQTYKKGTVNRSILYLSERWGWDRKKTKKFLDLLAEDNMITLSSTTHGTTITLVNYGFYAYNGTTDTPTEGQPIPQPMVQPLPTNNNDNNVNNDNNLSREETTHTFGMYGNVYLTDGELKELIKQYPDDYKDMIENLSFYMRSRGKRYDDHFATMMRWKHDDAKKQATKNYDYRKDVK